MYIKQKDFITVIEEVFQFSWFNDPDRCIRFGEPLFTHSTECTDLTAIRLCIV
jgi:hypothetical protein